jgi:rhodanese-related sulfurtransferase
MRHEQIVPEPNPAIGLEDFSMKILVPLFTALALFVPGLAYAASPPKMIEGVQTVDRAYVAKASAEKSALLVDFRPTKVFASGTIPGAVNCPGIAQEPQEISTAEMDKARGVIAKCPALARAAKGKEIIAFCSHTGCWISAKAAAALHRDGFTNVKWFSEGYNAWKAKGS